MICSDVCHPEEAPDQKPGSCDLCLNDWTDSSGISPPCFNLKRRMTCHPTLKEFSYRSLLVRRSQLGPSWRKLRERVDAYAHRFIGFQAAWSLQQAFSSTTEDECSVSVLYLSVCYTIILMMSASKQDDIGSISPIVHTVHGSYGSEVKVWTWSNQNNYSLPLLKACLSALSSSPQRWTGARPRHLFMWSLLRKKISV